MKVRTHNLTFIHSFGQLVGSIQTVNESKLVNYRRYFMHGITRGSQPDLGIQDTSSKPRLPFFGATPFFTVMPPRDSRPAENLMDMDNLVVQHNRMRKRKHD